ncbi:MAG: DUF935 family protein [Sandaracinaceae bacterium]
MKTTTTPLAAAGDLFRAGFDLFGRALRGIVRPVDEDGRERGEQPAAVPSELGPLTVESVATIRDILAEHLEGSLTESGCLAVALLSDADVVGALGQRLLALQACPTRIHPADESAEAQAEAADLEARWSRMVPRAAMGDIVGGAIFLGAALGQLVYHPGPDGELEPRLEAWPWHAAEYRRSERRWYVHTVDGTYPITPGDGQWVLFAPRSDMQPLAWGVIRAIAVPSLRGDYGDADLSRHGEVHGSPAWVVDVPLDSRKSEDAKGLVRGLRNLGRNAVIPVPKSKREGESYDVRLEQAKAEAAKVFEAIRRNASGRIRLAILGQNLTSQNDKVGTNASSESGEGVTDLVVTADGLGWGETMTAQVALAWARRRGKPACRVEVDTERESDAKADAEAAKAEAEAVAAWESAGVEVDKVAHATKAGMVGAKLKAAASPPPPPKTSTETTP